MVQVSVWVFPQTRHFHPWVESLHSCVSPHLLATELPVLMSSAHHDSLPSLQLTTVSAGHHRVSQKEGFVHRNIYSAFVFLPSAVLLSATSILWQCTPSSRSWFVLGSSLHHSTSWIRLVMITNLI